MKLIKLYSNKPFQHITFITDNGGLNVILGDANTSKGNSHCLGKSKLAELLDFMLLKKTSNNFFFYKENIKEKFKGYNFYLEILVNSKQYITIKRNVDEPTKIAFKVQATQSVDFLLYEQFDTILPFDKAKQYLNKCLDFDFCKQNSYDFRKIVNYSLRLQGDYEPKNNTIFQLSKFNNKNDKDSWRVLIFSLLGFDGNLLIKKYDLEQVIKKGNEYIKNKEKDIGVKATQKDSLIGKIQNATIEKESLESELATFNFYKEDKNTIQKLVGSIELDIALLNTNLYNLEYEIQQLSSSIKNEFSFDLDKVKSLFEEVSIYFPQQLTKSYQDLLTFNHEITQERNKYIREAIKEKEQEKKEINEKLQLRNAEKHKYIALIQDTTLFKKYNLYHKKLVELEKKLTLFQSQLEDLRKIEQDKEEIEEKEESELRDIKNKLKDVLDNTNKNTLYMKIRRTFSEIVQYILNEEALITIKYNNNYNIDFSPEFPDSAKHEGNTYYKILCVAFDLAILINYSHQSHFRFLYHDDIIAGDDNGIKKRLIETVKKYCQVYNIQYIFSAVKDNIPASVDLSENIILTLHDKNEAGKLFKMNF